MSAPIAGLYWFTAKINAYDRCDFWLQKKRNSFERGQYNTDSDDVGWWSNQLTKKNEMSALRQYVDSAVTLLLWKTIRSRRMQWVDIYGVSFELMINN